MTTSTEKAAEPRFTIRAVGREMLADTVTPVGIYLKVRDVFPNSLLLESSDYHGQENSYSFICMEPMAEFVVDKGQISAHYPDGTAKRPQGEPVALLESFVQAFGFEEGGAQIPANGLFGYASFDAAQRFERITFRNPTEPAFSVPEIRYCAYRYVIAIDHFKNRLTLVENQVSGAEAPPSRLAEIETLIQNRNYAFYPFQLSGQESSNLTDEAYQALVSKGVEHCHRGDVFQIVFSRQFSQGFQGDEFNVYRALRSVNPSPYLFYFDYGAYKIFGSSPEAQIVVKDETAFVNPIAGTVRRTGDDQADKRLADQLAADKKENAEHVMLVDLARNDLSRNSDEVKVLTYREVQYFSHVIHLVSKVSGRLRPGASAVRIMADTFPAGTLSGAPKYRAMQLIDQYENQSRSYYGGAIGFIGFDGSLNHAIMIRSFLAKGNRLFYQAGAGIVADSQEESELQEVNNKLAALRRAVLQAQNL